VKYLKILFLFLGLAAITALIFFLPRLIRINKISCKSQYGECSLDLTERFAKLQGKSLFDARGAIGEELSGERTISDFMIQFKLPSNLVVNVLEKKPKYALKAGDTYALVDKEGLVIKIEKETPLPYIELTGVLPNVGEKVSQENNFALELMYNVYASYQVRGGRLENQSLVVELPQGLKVIFPLEGEKEVLLGALRVILDRLNESDKDSRIGKEITEVDLRFQNPVLK